MTIAPDPLGTLDRRPRADLSGPPSPLEPLPRLSAAAGGRLWAKRDDLLPIAMGGNKVRQLEFYFGAALAEGADTVLITGAVQSNYCRLTAAIAAKLGLGCHIQAEERVPDADATYRGSGNMLLQRLLGATVHSYPEGEDEAGADAALNAIAEGLRAEGRRPYVIPLGPGHAPLGALGYVRAARELAAQIDAAGIAAPHVAVASGSGATHAGLLTGLRALGRAIPVTGVCVRRPAVAQAPRLAARCAEIAALLEIDNPVAEGDIRLTDRFLAPGYGRLNLPTERAIALAARQEGMLTDPVYTAKTLAGAINLAGTSSPETTVIFLHTGGTPGLFAYAPEIARIAETAP
ncbi:D-cysteine desulfhydrase family protein [Paralimibaculum aggregatum]|nr:D-cysteine desulfhydrase family protein [Limibaculum sp. NKW23]